MRTFAASIYIHAPISIAATLEQLLRHSKSIGPSAPIAYATSVSPPNKAVAWPGAGVECRMRLPFGLGEVPAIHRAHESLFYAPLGHIGVRGGFNLSSSSTRLKVNHLCIRYLCFESMRGDLQELHHGPGDSLIQHQRPAPTGQAAASFGGDTEVA